MPKRVDELIRELKRRSGRAKIGALLEIHAQLVTTTPVDTGHASSNWVPSVGAPNRGIVGSPASPDRASAQTALAEIVAAGGTDGDLYISNNVPYINRLNAGSSDQAPAGFVETAVSVGLAIARRKFRR